MSLCWIKNKTGLKMSLTALAAALALAGCGSDDDSTSPVASNPASTSGSPSSTPGNTTATPTAANLTQYVNPLIGTAPGSSSDPTAHGAGGNTLPAAGLPSGMVQWGPDTNNSPVTSSSYSTEVGSPSGYYYDQSDSGTQGILGFSLTHMSGTGGSGNNGEIPFSPMTDASNTTLAFSHSNETAKPGYYTVKLDNGIDVELTATLRSGFGRFTYPAGQPAILKIDTTRTNTYASTAGSVNQVSGTEISGYTNGGNFESTGAKVPVYFYAQFSSPWNTSSTISGGVATLNFDSGSTVLVKVGISYVSIDNAKQNVETENSGWDFNSVQAAADTSWNKKLSTIVVSKSTTDTLTNFYTALYHALWAPSIFSDVNGQYIGFDNATHTVSSGQGAQYSGFSTWDVYRTQMPLLAFLFPKETSDMLQSLVNDADQCGAIPRWVNDNYDSGTMIGDGGTNIVTTGYAFGATNFDTASALTHIIKQLNTNNQAMCRNAVAGDSNSIGTNGGRSTSLKFGYITSGESAIASSSLEYDLTDFAASQFANTLGNAWFAKQALGRSAGWQYSINTSLPTPLLEARNTDGTWINASQNTTTNFEQGSAEQYTWLLPQNLSGLFARLGGKSVVQSRLDTMVTNLNDGNGSQYLYIGNEPSFAVPWVYNWAGAPSKTSDVIQRIVATQFSNTPGGLPGNDDMGATSSWYVWAMLGLYPQVPGVAGFALSSPQFQKATITLENGNTITINADGAPSSNYIQGLNVNGSAVNTPWLSYDAVKNGGTLAYSMAASPSGWGTDASNAPPSYGLPEYPSISEAYNSQGFSADGSTNADGSGAAFDGSLNSFSSNALAAGYFGSGSYSNGMLTTLGASFTLPYNLATNQQQLDNVIAAGQTIDLASGGGTQVVFLGSAVNGGGTGSTGNVAINYTDGTSSTASLVMGDGTLNGSASRSPASSCNLTASLPAPDTVAVAMGYRNASNGTSGGNCSYLFSQAVPVLSGKTVKSVTLPSNVDKGKMHIFGIAMSSM